MELVTAAFFEKGDFSEFSLLINAYNHLNACLPEASSQHLYEGNQGFFGQVASLE